MVSNEPRTACITLTPGDVNGDTNVDLTDAILSLQITTDSASGRVLKEADVDGNGAIGIEEAIKILDELANPPES